MPWAAWLVTGLMVIGGATAAHGASRWGGPDGTALMAQLQEAIAPPGDGLAAPPTAQDALATLARFGSIRIDSLDGFNPENGVRGGRGTAQEPFLLEGFYADRLTIEDVEAHYVIRDAFIRETLRLDYTGAGAQVRSSTIGFFLTDTNRPHDAPHTWLDVRGNHMGAARIRHAGGIFADNVIGAPGAFDPNELALEVQGYNGLQVTRNTVHGPVEFRLHGHHYSPSFDEAWTPMHGHDHGDPATRYHEVRVHANAFLDASGRGVAISDRDHAANHATAKSAPDPRLNEAHEHHLRFVFEDNRIVGAGLVIEKANAEDAKHTGGITSILASRNDIRDPLAGVGIEVRGANQASVELVENRVAMSAGRVADSVGIMLRGAQGGHLFVQGGEIQGFEQGVRAAKLDADVDWGVDGVRFVDVEQGVWWDRSVKRPPQGDSGAAPPAAPAAPAPHAGH